MRIDIIKNQILQYFTHIYRRKRYVFLIMYTLIELYRDDLNLEDINEKTTDKSILDAMLNFLIYKLQTI